MLDESVVRNEYNALCARIGEERAYLTLAKKFHPDRGNEPNAIAFQHLEKTCEKFKDNKKRTKELEGQAMERQAKKNEMDELAAKKQCSLAKLEEMKAAGEKERQKRQRAQDRKTARMNAESGGAITPTIAPPTSIETVTEPCPSTTEKEVSAPATGVTYTAEQEDVATTPDTSLPPNTAALDIFNGIIRDLNNGTLKVPMNGHEEYAHGTFKRNVAPIRSLLENKFNDVPVSSSETDLVHILENVATRTDIPKTDDAQLNKLPTAAKWFLKVLRSNVGDDSPVALCDTTVSPPVEKTIESDAPDAPPVQEDASPPPDAPQQSILVKKRASRKNSKAKKRTKEQDVESTTEEVTRPVKMQKSNDLMGNTDFVLNLVEGGTITLPNTSKGTPYKLGSIKGYRGQVRKLLKGNVNGITIDLNETNPFRVLDNVLKNHMDVIDKHDAGCNNQLSCGIKLILKLHKQFPQFKF